MSSLSKVVTGFWSEVTGRRWVRLLVLLASAGMVGLAVWLLFMAQRSGDLTELTAMAGIAGVSLALLLGAAPMLLWVFRRTQQPASSYLPELAAKVARKENDNLVLLLGHEHPTADVAMEPAKARTPVRRRLVDWLAVRFEEQDRTFGIGEAGEYFAGLAVQRLVVVGEAGAGKTVLAMCLAEQLAAAANPTVLIRASMSDWDPEGENLIAWFGRHLASAYGLSVGVARTLVTDGDVVAVLDGLDEMDIGGGQARPRRAVERINEYLGAQPRMRKVVLLSRPDVYRSLGLTIAGVHKVRLLQLDDPKVDDYLELRFGHLHGMARRWQRTVATLPRADRSLLHRPLWLYLACEVFAEHPEGLRVNDGLRATLLDRFVGSVARRHPNGTDLWRIENRLATLATYLRRQAANGGSAVDIEPSRLWLLAPARTVKTCTWLAKAAVVMVLPLAVVHVPAVFAGLAALLVESQRSAGAPNYLVVAAVATAAVMLCGLVAFQVRRNMPGAAARRWNNERATVLVVVIIGLAVGSKGGSLVPITDLVAAATYAVPLIGMWLGKVGQAVGFLFGLPLPGADEPEAPVRSLWYRVESGCGVVLHTVLTIGLVRPGLEYLGIGVSNQVQAWMLLAALLLPMVIIRLAAIPSRLPRILVSSTEAIRGAFPLRRTAFLSWCVTAGLMRTSGSAYQFRHRELQDHLAAESDR